MLLSKSNVCLHSSGQDEIPSSPGGDDAGGDDDIDDDGDGGMFQSTLLLWI